MKKNKKKIILVVIILLIIVCVCLFVFSKEEEVEKTIVIKDSIDSYSYTLDDRDTEFFEAEYEILKEILLADEVDFELYASQISKLFVIDFYTLNNKISRYDVGGLEYLNDDIESNFNLKAEDYIYKYLSVLDELPEVNFVTIDEITESTVTFNEEDYTGYLISLSWEYVVDLGYDSTGTIEIILNNEKLEIVEFIGVN